MSDASFPARPSQARMLKSSRRDIQDVFIESGIREISQAVALQANAANANSGQQTIVKAGFTPMVPAWRPCYY